MYKWKTLTIRVLREHICNVRTQWNVYVQQNVLLINHFSVGCNFTQKVTLCI